VLEKEDLISAIKYLVSLRRGEGTVDDIDHLGSRRVRTVGELVETSARVGPRPHRAPGQGADDDFRHDDREAHAAEADHPKALAAVIRDFFGRSQLSQFMDQTNPLAELTHKRRLSALVRRPQPRARGLRGARRALQPLWPICPIETPKAEHRPYLVPQHVTPG